MIAPALRYTVPLEDMPTFAQLSPDDRAEVELWLKIFDEFSGADNRCATLQRLVLSHKHRTRISQGTVYRKLERYRAEGWRCLVHGAKLRAVDARALPQPFVAHWQARCLDNQRKVAPAYRSLFFDDLIPGKVIPGYGDWRRVWKSEHPGWSLPDSCPYRPYDNTPNGWGYRNLLRYAPTVFEHTAARIGLGAASKYLPKVPTTRAGLHIGQFYVLDDVWHDIKVNFLGNRNAHMPLELGALELLTGHYCVWGLKPIIERADGTRQMLPERYLRYLMAHILCRIGIHPQGCTFLGEHGTARIPEGLLGAINRWADGRVRFEAGGVHGAPIAKGLYAGRPRGNSRFKAALESNHNLKHNELAQLPGQKGMDRDHAPEELYGRDQENRALVKAVHALADERPDLVSQLRLPFCSFAHFSEFLHLIYGRIADRKHHALEGFEESGLTLQEFRLAKGLPWMPMSELDQYDPEQRRAFEIIMSRPGMAQLRPMSPLEAFESRRHELVRLPDCALPAILGPELGDTPTVTKDLELHVKDADIPNRVHQFVAVVTLPNGREEPLARGRSYLVHVSPFGDSLAYISDEQGRFIGTAKAMPRGCRTDVETVQQALGMLRHAMSAELKRLAPLGEKRLRERFEDTQHNVRVLTGTDPIEQQYQAEQDAAEARRRAAFIPDDLATDPRELPDDDPVPAGFAASDLL